MARGSLPIWCGPAVAGWLFCTASCGPDVVAIVGRFDAGSGPSDAGAREASHDVVDGGEPTHSCPARLAADLLQHALCTCGGVNLIAGLNTDAFDSRLGAYGPQTQIGGAGHVGIAGALFATDLLASRLVIDGDMSIASISPPGLVLDLAVSGDLSVTAPFTSLASVEVAGDLVLGSDLLGSGDLHVAGDLRQEASAARDPALGLRVDGSDQRGPLLVPPPCPCEQARALDVGLLVARAKAQNDNAAAQFDPDALAGVVAPALPSLEVAGTLFASSIDVAGSLTLIVHGKAALVLEGSMNIAGELQLQIDPEGSLDLIVGGDLLWGGAQVLGAATRPAQLRVYVASGRQVALGTPTGFLGHLYAPAADVVTTTSEIYGSMLTRELLVTLPLTIHRDLAVNSGADCGPFAP